MSFYEPTNYLKLAIRTEIIAWLYDKLLKQEEEEEKLEDWFSLLRW